MPRPESPENMTSREHTINILFLFSPYTGRLPPHTFEINLGAAYLAAFLQRRGLRSLFYTGEYSNDPAFPEVMGFIEAHRPKSIGFTVYGSNVQETVVLCRAIKSCFPHIPILWGGPDVRFRASEFLETCGDFVDILITGEGEKPLLKLLVSEEWSTNCVAGIPGVAFRDVKNGRFIKTEPGTTLLEDQNGSQPCTDPLDIYPSPYLAEIFPQSYMKNRLSFGMLSARGCPFRCIYCQFSVLGNRKVHFHSVDRLISEIRWIHDRVLELSPKRKEIYIQILDDIFTIAPNRVKALCSAVTAEDFQIPLKFGMNTRADHVDETLLKNLGRAGFVNVNFGVESGVPSVLKVIRKVSCEGTNNRSNTEPEKAYLEQVNRAVLWSKKAGLSPTVSIIAGLPTEGPQQLRETLRFVETLNLKSYTHNYLNLLEGTELAQRRREFGYSWRPNIPGYLGKYGHRYTVTPFPSREVAPLKHAKVFRIDARRFSFMLRGAHYSHFFALSSIGKDRYAPSVLWVTPDDHSFSNLWSFLAHFSGLSVNLFFHDHNPSVRTVLEKMLKRLPMKMARLYAYPGPGSSGNRIGALEEADHSTPYCLSLKTLKPGDIPDNGRNIFVRIDDETDVHFLKELFIKWGYYGQKGLPHHPVHRSRIDILEFCRWTALNGQSCPADSLTHLHMGNNGELSPCTFFPSVGQIDETCSFKTLREKIRKYQQGMEHERGCADCSAGHICPRCPAPHPLTHEAYCRFQRGLFAGTKDPAFRLSETGGAKT